MYNESTSRRSTPRLDPGRIVQSQCNQQGKIRDTTTKLNDDQ